MKLIAHTEHLGQEPVVVQQYLLTTAGYPKAVVLRKNGRLELVDLSHLKVIGQEREIGI